MTTGEFLQQLEKELQGLQAEERENALAYYREYFEEADSEDGVDVVERLGSPQSVAARIISEMGDGHAESVVYPKSVKAEKTPSEKKGGSRVGMVILWILLFLVTFPLLIVLLSLCFALVVVLLCLLITFLALAILGPILGIVGMMQGLWSYGLQNLGGGLLCLGLVMLLWKPFFWMIGGCFKLLGKLIAKGFRKCFRKEKTV